MKRTHLLLETLSALAVASLLLGSGLPTAYADDEREENTLLVWAGDQARIKPDFLAVVDFDRNSARYGKVLRTVPLDGASAVGNEPHHVGVSSDGRTLALGGLLSILRRHDQVFFFDVTDPRHPEFIRSDNPKDASIADEFAPLRAGGFLATFMGGAQGSQPGRVVEYDPRSNAVRSWPSQPPSDGFNPHGISIDEAHNLMVTSDFICPLLTLHVHNGDRVDLRGTIRVWDLAQRAVTKTIVVGDPAKPAGTIDVHLIPHDERLRAFTAGMADNRLYLVDTQHGAATAVFSFDIFANADAPVWPQLMRINETGTRLFVTLNYAGAGGKVVMLDITRPDRPAVVSVVDLGPGSGPHYLRLTADEKRLVVSDYFLVEDLAPGGVVHAEGDHRIHVFNVGPHRLELDPRFDLDFNRDISTGPARPHGMATFHADAD
jgi:DNA-binding beta-propeller fold protein YncE